MSLKRNYQKRVLSCALVFLIIFVACAVNAALLEQKFVAVDTANHDQFGSALAVSGNYAIVGADHDDDNGSSSGSAYIFQFNGSTWIEQQKLVAKDGASYDYFGKSVAISGDYAIVGADGDDDKGSASGSAYMFHFNGTTWGEQRKLIASDGKPDDRFGSAVAISGNSALVGAYGSNCANSGSAYTFHFDGTDWLQGQKLIASDAEDNDTFGRSVALLNDGHAIVGADGSYGGTIYAFADFAKMAA